MHLARTIKCPTSADLAKPLFIEKHLHAVVVRREFLSFATRAATGMYSTVVLPSPFAHPCGMVKSTVLYSFLIRYGKELHARGRGER